MANKPEYKVKVGAVQLAVWKNSNGKFDSESVTLSRTYKTKDGKFETTNSMRMQDLPLIKLAIDEVMRVKYLKEAKESEPTEVTQSFGAKEF